MTASRRVARPTCPSTRAPSESGPRCTRAELMAVSRAGSTAPRVVAIPQIPPMRHYSSDAVSGFGAHEELQLLVLLICAAALLLLADPLRIPYPILLVGGRVVRFVRKRLFNPPLEVTIAFLPGYFAFLPAAAIGVSGVLAAVTAGVYMGWHTPELTTVETRLQGAGFWAIFNFLLNALLFGLVGLQLQPILDQLHGRSWQELVGYAALVWAVVALTRIGYGPPIAYVPRWVSASLRERDPPPPWQFVAFIAWAGMRGGVTLAAALAIPLETDSGGPFPDRSLIVFLAFCVVLGSLVVQGLSLPGLVRVLRLEEDDAADVREEAKARIHGADAAVARLDGLVEEE